MLGYPGRKFEISLGKARAINPQQVLSILEHKDSDTNATNETVSPQKKSPTGALLMKITSNSSTIPIKVEGIKNNILIDKTGLFFNDFELIRLIVPPYGKAEGSENIDKLNRIQWKKDSYYQAKRGKNVDKNIN